MPEEIKSFLEEHSKPILISVVSAALTFASTWGAVQTKISDLQRAAEITRSEYVTRAEFTQFSAGMSARLDDVKVLLLELRDADRRAGR